MPNVSASLSDEAYRIWTEHEGKKSPWISELIEKGDSIMRLNMGLRAKVGHLQSLLAEAMTQLRTSRQGLTEEEWERNWILLWNQVGESLEGSIHRYHLNDYKDEVPTN